MSTLVENLNLNLARNSVARVFKTAPGKVVGILLLLVLFNLGYWGLRMWGHGLWVVYFSLAALVWWRYPRKTVRIRIVALLILQLCFESLPRWVPASYGGGDGGYT